MIKRLLLSGAIALSLGGAAHAQANNSNTWATPGNQTVGGAVQLCARPIDGVAVPCNGATGAGGYPAGATPEGAVFSGADTTTATATLSGAAGKFTYICGFTISGLGATGLTAVSPTLAAPLFLTFTYAGAYTFVAGATLANVPFTQTFSPCLPGNALNSGMIVTVPGAAGNTATTINIWGYVL